MLRYKAPLPSATLSLSSMQWFWVSLPGPAKRATRVQQLVLAVLSCAATTLLAGGLLHFFAPSNVVMLFLLTVVLLALRLGRFAGACGAVLCVASFDFFFVEPRFSFAVSDTQYLFTFVLMLAVALVTGELAARLRAEARIARAGERRATAVARVARELSGAIEIEQIVEVCTQTIAPLVSAQVTLVLPDRYDQLAVVCSAANTDTMTTDTAIQYPADLASGAPTHWGARSIDHAIAQWVYAHGQPAGRGTNALPATGALYLPLRGPMRMRGVLALTGTNGGELSNDGDDRWVLDACCSLIGLALERTHFVEIAQDTQLRIEGERLRNVLLAAVSHDLRTPLTAIGGLAQTLELGDLPTAERITVSKAIRLRTEGLHRLVSNLLDLARMQSEGVRLNTEWHALSEIAGSALARTDSVLAGHRVRTELPLDLPLIEIDAIAFERVLVNLLDNAAKYTPAGCTVWIRAKVSEDKMHIFIEDDGPGLPRDDLNRLFDAFSRGVKESSITGVGLGLALCRTIVAAHAGTIELERRQPQGARFEIVLPLGTPPVIEHNEHESAL